MKKSYKVAFIAIFSLPVLAFFQNCSDVSFQSLDGARLVAKSENTALGGEEVIIDNSETSPYVVEEIPEEELPPVIENEGALQYTCVLDGPGSSTRLHLEQALTADVSTINVVCTSRSACEDIVSQAFNVKFAKPSGYCGKNPHAVSLTGAQITELLTK